MNQSKKILAAMLAIPATVIVAGEVQAADVTSTFEIKNSFVGTMNATENTSEKIITATTKDQLKNGILAEMEKFTEGFTVTYTASDIATAEKDTREIFEGLKKI